MLASARMTEQEAYAPLVAYLHERGHDDDEIAAIFRQLRRYDHLTNADAVMDAISSGDIDLEALVREANDE